MTPQTAEQLYQRNPHTVKKVQGPTVDFPNWGSSKGTENPREFDFLGQWDLITEFPQDWGNRLLEGTNKTLGAPGARRKEQRPHKRLIRLACECPGVSSRDSGQATGREHNPIHQQKIGVKIY